MQDSCTLSGSYPQFATLLAKLGHGVQVEVAGLPVWAWTASWFAGGVLLGLLVAFSCAFCCWKRREQGDSAKSRAYASTHYPSSIRQVCIIVSFHQIIDVVNLVSMVEVHKSFCAACRLGKQGRCLQRQYCRCRFLLCRMYPS